MGKAFTTYNEMQISAQAYIRPDSDDEAGLLGFRSTVQEDKALESQGLIEINDPPHEENITGKRYIDFLEIKKIK